MLVIMPLLLNTTNTKISLITIKSIYRGTKAKGIFMQLHF